jgi:hypothetical protein
MTGIWMDAGAAGSAVNNAATVGLMLICLVAALLFANRRIAHLPPRPHEDESEAKGKGQAPESR